MFTGIYIENLRIGYYNVYSPTYKSKTKNLKESRNTYIEVHNILIKIHMYSRGHKFMLVWLTFDL